jgi:hypothetical protein
MIYTPSYMKIFVQTFRRSYSEDSQTDSMVIL